MCAVRANVCLCVFSQETLRNRNKSKLVNKKKTEKRQGQFSHIVLSRKRPFSCSGSTCKHTDCENKKSNKNRLVFIEELWPCVCVAFVYLAFPYLALSLSFSRLLRYFARLSSLLLFIQFPMQKGFVCVCIGISSHSSFFSARLSPFSTLLGFD